MPSYRPGSFAGLGRVYGVHGGVFVEQCSPESEGAQSETGCEQCQDEKSGPLGAREKEQGSGKPTEQGGANEVHEKSLVATLPS